MTNTTTYIERRSARINYIGATLPTFIGGLVVWSSLVLLMM